MVRWLPLIRSEKKTRTNANYLKFKSPIKFCIELKRCYVHWFFLCSNTWSNHLWGSRLVWGDFGNGMVGREGKFDLSVQCACIKSCVCGEHKMSDLRVPLSSQFNLQLVIGKRLDCTGLSTHWLCHFEVTWCSVFKIARATYSSNALSGYF